jgi:hypothetical protein
MSVFGTLSVYSQYQDWLVAGISIYLAYFVIFPIYIFYLRNKHSRRIRRHLVTTAYKLPVNLTPTQLAYIFSSKVSKNQLYATLLDLTNRSLIVMEKEEHGTTISMGPKIDDNLEIFEIHLLNKIKESSRPVTVEKLILGTDSFETKTGEIIKGKSSYIYWWLQRESLRERKIIEKHMTSRYLVLLFKFGVIGGLLISTIPLIIVRFVQMLQSGEVDITILKDNIYSGLIFWIITLIPVCIASFFLLRFKGRMLGRSWLLTNNFKRYLGQLDAFREYVRLSHKDKLRFESKELKKESVARTRPYAIACGYIKP